MVDVNQGCDPVWISGFKVFGGDLESHDIRAGANCASDTCSLAEMDWWWQIVWHHHRVFVLSFQEVRRTGSIIDVSSA